MTGVGWNSEELCWSHRTRKAAESIQDREPPTPAPSALVSTVPASSGALRMLVLVNSQQTEPSAAAISKRSLGVARGDQNRFEAVTDVPS